MEQNHLSLIHQKSNLQSDQLAAGVAQLNLDGGFIWVNQQLCHLLGYHKDELLKFAEREITHPDDQSISEELKSLSSILQGNVYSLTKRYLCKDGSLLLANITAEAVKPVAPESTTQIMLTLQPIQTDSESDFPQAARDKMFCTLFDIIDEGATLNEMVYDSSATAIDYRIIEANEAFLQLIGLPKHKVEGQLASVIYDQTPPPYFETYKKVTLGGKQSKFEVDFTILGKRYQVTVFSPQQGQFATVFSEITEKQIVEHSLQQALLDLERERNFFKSLLQNLPDLIWMKDLEGVYLTCNSEFEKFVGFSEKEILGKTDYDFFDAEQADSFRMHDRLAVEKGEKSVNEEWITYVNSEHPVLLETTKTPILNGYGEAIGVLGIGHDITLRKQQEENLKQNKSLLQEAQQLSKVGNWEYNYTKNEWLWSAEVYAIFEYDEQKQKPGYEALLNAVHPDDLNKVKELYHQSLVSQKPYTLTHRLLLDGRIKHVEQKGKTEYDQNDNPIRTVATVQDVTDRVNYEVQINRFNHLVNQSTDNIFVINAETGRIIDTNTAAYQILGYSREELLQLHVWEVSGRISNKAMWLQHLQGYIDNQGTAFESTHRHKEGHIIPVEISARYIEEADGDYFIAISRDITERKEAEQQIQFMAYNDVLTRLPNRRLFVDRMSQAILLARRDDTPLAICYIDLDGFKPINDRLGHDAGDQLLVQIAHRIQQSLRKGDSLARLGGDEFALFLSNLESIFHGEEIVQRILDLIVQPFEIGTHRIHISASIGVTLFPHDDADPDTLLRHADQAMYKAKENGKNTFRLFDPIQDHKVHAHRKSLKDFEIALLDSQLVLHYQPRIELSTGNLSSVEALVHWQHPEQGLLTPDQFLPLIQNTPLELALDEWVISAALDQHQQWCNLQGLKLPISINLNPRHIQQKSFPRYLEEKLAAYSSDMASYLEFEILETSAIGNTQRVSEIMKACVELGVKFSLDDFGTGYSSLTYFHQLPISVLKIDQHFVRNMLANAQDQNIVEGVLNLSKALKKPVVAEGVENIQLGIILLRLGCQYAQGYGIAKPMPPESLLQWQQNWNQDSDWFDLKTTTL